MAPEIVSSVTFACCIYNSDSPTEVLITGPCRLLLSWVQCPMKCKCAVYFLMQGEKNDGFVCFTSTLKVISSEKHELENETVQATGISRALVYNIALKMLRAHLYQGRRKGRENEPQ